MTFASSGADGFMQADGRKSSYFGIVPGPGKA